MTISGVFAFATAVFTAAPAALVPATAASFAALAGASLAFDAFDFAEPVAARVFELPEEPLLFALLEALLLADAPLPLDAERLEERFLVLVFERPLCAFVA